jgi:hypothetical protein
MWSCFLMMQMFTTMWLYLWKRFNKIILRRWTWLLCFHICRVDWCLLILRKLLGWKWSNILYFVAKKYFDLEKHLVCVVDYMWGLFWRSQHEVTNLLPNMLLLFRVCSYFLIHCQSFHQISHFWILYFSISGVHKTVGFWFFARPKHDSFMKMWI